MSIEIPLVHKYQTNQINCGPASLQMILEYFKKSEEQDRLAKRMKTNDDPGGGTEAEEMIREGRRQGFYCYANAKGTSAEIRYFLSRGLPVVVWYRVDLSEQEDHYSVVYGFRGKTFFVADPLDGKREMEESELEKHWYEDAIRNKGWMLVLSPEEFKLGKQYKPLFRRKNKK